ncbi:hypothetical protein CTEN210_01483 [Chaetoceros tenuissimus]|uniref:Folate/biopterin transporter n=1 Tax=Chaetoceros tenuissimus TaxID=426638 RepID=A0AAD3CG43_9STRA|nr:hypothetical protein CTEN210_01483 [Chaetoceros tenuissimus]
MYLSRNLKVLVALSLIADSLQWNALPVRYPSSTLSRSPRSFRCTTLLHVLKEDIEEESLTSSLQKDEPLPSTYQEADDFQSILKEKLFLGIEPTPEVLSIMAIYFVEGALGLARLAQTFFLKDELHLGPAELSALTGLFTLPWTIKPIYGFLSDGVPLFGYRRRSYLILCGFLGAACYAGLGSNFLGLFDSADSPISLLQATIASFVVSSGCIAFSDVVADGIVVQRTRDSNDPKVAGGLQSLCWGSASIGGLISAYFSGSLLEVMGPKEVFTITAALPLLVASIAFFINEESIDKKKALPSSNVSTTEVIDFQPETSSLIPSTPVQTSGKDISANTAALTDESFTIKKQVESLWQAIKEPAVWKPALFLFLWQSTPTSDGAFLYYMTNDLGFGPEFLGRVRLITAAASLAGVWGYQKFLRTVAIKDILFWSSIVSAPLGLIQLLLITHANRDLGIPDSAFVLGDDVVLAVLGEFAFLPTLVLAAKICPPGVEAVLFATLMSIFNGASVVGTEVGSVLTKQLGVTESNFDNLGLLTIICNLSSLYPLIFIGLLDGVGSKSEAEMEGGDVIRTS